MPVRAPRSLSSIATPVFPTRSTPSVRTIVEMRTVLSLLSASTTSCLTFVGSCRYSLSFAEPKDFHCACCCLQKHFTLHLRRDGRNNRAKVLCLLYRRIRRTGFCYWYFCHGYRPRLCRRQQWSRLGHLQPPGSEFILGGIPLILPG